MNSKMSVVSTGGSIVGVSSGGGGAGGGQKKIAAIVENESPTQKRPKRESKSLEGWKKRESTFREPPTKKESRTQGVSLSKIRKESNTQDSMQPQQQQQQQRTYALRSSRISMQWQRRQSVGGSYRSGVYSNDASLRRHALENSFRLTPTDEERFCSSRVDKVLEEFLANFLEGEQYDAQKCSQMALQMSNIIKELVKKMDFRRHKLSCHVIVGQKLGQGMQISSRCLWDSKQDGSASAVFCNGSLFAIATVYAIFYE